MQRSNSIANIRTMEIFTVLENVIKYYKVIWNENRTIWILIVGTIFILSDVLLNINKTKNLIKKK